MSRPSRHIAPITKLTDANNTARPELSSQRKAVQAFHERRAHELENTTVAGQDPPAVAAGLGSTPPSMSPPKHNTITITTSSIGPSEDDGIDDHPRPCI